MLLISWTHKAEVRGGGILLISPVFCALFPTHQGGTLTAGVLATLDDCELPEASASYWIPLMTSYTKAGTLHCILVAVICICQHTLINEQQSTIITICTSVSVLRYPENVSKVARLQKAEISFLPSWAYAKLCPTVSSRYDILLIVRDPTLNNVLTFVTITEYFLSRHIFSIHKLNIIQ